MSQIIQSEKQNSVKLIEYTIKWGDRLYQIAKFHGVKVRDILNVNPQITNPDYIILAFKAASGRLFSLLAL